MACLGGSSASTRVIKSGRGPKKTVGGSRSIGGTGHRDAVLLFLEMEEGAMSQGMRAAWRSWGRPGRSRRSLGLLTVMARHYERPAAPTPWTLWRRTIRPWSQACALPCGLLSFPVWCEINPLAVLVRVHPRVEGLPAARAHAHHGSSCAGGPGLVSGCWLLHVHCRDHLWHTCPRCCG